MSQLTLSRGTNYRKNIFKRFFPNVELGPYFLIVSLIMFVGLVTVITLMFSARQVTKGYMLNALEAQHQEIARENEKVEMKISEVRSLNYLKESSKVKSMRTPGQIVFVSGDTAIAKR